MLVWLQLLSRNSPSLPSFDTLILTRVLAQIFMRKGQPDIHAKRPAFGRGEGGVSKTIVFGTGYQRSHQQGRLYSLNCQALLLIASTSSSRLQAVQIGRASCRER